MYGITGEWKGGNCHLKDDQLVKLREIGKLASFLPHEVSC